MQVNSSQRCARRWSGRGQMLQAPPCRGQQHDSPLLHLCHHPPLLAAPPCHFEAPHKTLHVAQHFYPPTNTGKGCPTQHPTLRTGPLTLWPSEGTCSPVQTAKTLPPKCVRGRLQIPGPPQWTSERRGAPVSPHQQSSPDIFGFS